MPSVAILYGGKIRPPGACEIYRGNMPLYFLGQHGWWVTWDFLVRKLWDALGDFDTWLQFIDQHDVIVLARLYLPDGKIDQVQDFFDIIRKMGKKVVYETDDDYSNDYRAVIPGDAMSVAKACDALTVTQPYLAENILARIGPMPTFSLPNMLDPMVWKQGTVPRKVSADTLVIGLSGSTTHERDWRVLETVLPAIIEKHPTVRFSIAGYHPDYLQGLENVEYLFGFPYVQYAEYVRQCDIVLAPVDPDDGFNLGKSPIKAVEGMGAARLVQNRFGGAAVIATDNPIYRQAVTSGKDGLLVDFTPSAWFDAIDQLITEPTYRQEMQVAAYKTAWKKWDISKGWTLWNEAYRKIIHQSPALAKGVLS